MMNEFTEAITQFMVMALSVSLGLLLGWLLLQGFFRAFFSPLKPLTVSGLRDKFGARENSYVLRRV
jgi:hypothetical protein